MTDNLSISEKVRALYIVAQFRPFLAIGIIGLSVFAALMEGIGLSFLVPIIELAQDPSAADGASGVLGVFVSAYELLGISLTLETVVIGVASVMVVRYSSSFIVAWLKASLRTNYVKELQTQSFDKALDARISYFDEEGSDDILNAIVTQSTYAGRTIGRGINIIEQGFLSLMYLLVALYFAPLLTLGAAVLLGGVTVIVRGGLESAYSVGDRVAEANERLQESAQAGTQGIRDVKLFGMADELFSNFTHAVGEFADSTIALRRNQAAIDNIYQMITAVTVFALIYVALAFAGMTPASLGVFLFAMFRLAPRVSTLNNLVYQLEGDLPHLVRTQEFIDDLDGKTEPNTADAPLPDIVDHVKFSEISFSYNDEEQVLRNVSFEVDHDEFVAFVGPSGAGKSTIVSLLARMYEPDSGSIQANQTPIDRFDMAAWRSRVAVVRQQPFIFNDTLRYNVTVGNRDASEEDIQRACEIAQVTEFLNDLPNGYETKLGDDGVRLSGGQRQRVSIARALLKDSDILVLDEATSDLDSTLEEKVHSAIEAMERDRAMIVIAHRLSTVMNADRIYTMDEGKISEVGTHAELVENDGKYARLFATQAQNS